MPESIRCQRFNHLNVVLEDFDQSIGLFQNLYQAEFLVDIPQPEWHAGLFHIGRVIFELFVPHQFLLNARYGAHFLGVEFQADMMQARDAIAAHGIRILRDVGTAVHTHPADCFGVAFEFYEGYFHDRNWPLLEGPIKDARYWSKHHPLGLTGLKSFTLAASDLDAACTFLQSFVRAEFLYEEPRNSISGRAVGLQVADTVIEVVTPVADGVLKEHLHRHGDGIRSAVFGVSDVDQAQRHLAERGIVCVPGGAPDTFAVPAECNAGIIFEFSA